MMHPNPSRSPAAVALFTAFALVFVPIVKAQGAPALTAQGCFGSAGGGMSVADTDKYQTSGVCGTKCFDLGKAVMALQGEECLCGNLLPATTSMLPSSSCDIICPGYGDETCGGASAYTVYLTGVDDSVGSVGSSGGGNGNSQTSQMPSSSTQVASSSTQPTKTPPPPSHHHEPSKAPTKPVTKAPPKTTVSTTTANQSTVKVTVPVAAPSDSSSHSGSSTSGTTIAIAVGVVAGICVFAALIIGVLFYLRRRRRMKNAENGHRRADSLNAFVAAGGHVPGPMAGRVPAVTLNDNRLDPRIMQETRRASAGSYLADNEDYSRRILKVTNPDGT